MMCAFMTPVLKNDWEVYNSKRSRNSSECSQKSLPNNNRSHAGDLRRKAMGEGRSMSYHMGNSKSEADMIYSKSKPRAYHLSARNSRNASRISFSAVNSGVSSPTKRHSKSVDQQRCPSSSSLTKFHSKVMDKLRNVLHLKEQDKTNNDANDESDNEVSEVRSNP